MTKVIALKEQVEELLSQTIEDIKVNDCSNNIGSKLALMDRLINLLSILYSYDKK